VLRAKRLHCVEDTRERFRDEIDLAGLRVDLCGGTSAVLPTRHLGKVRRGDVTAFSPALPLASFPLNAGAEPVPFAATLVAAEADWGGLEAHLADLHVVHDVGFLTDVVAGALTVAAREADPTLVEAVGISALVATLSPVLAPLTVAALLTGLALAVGEWRRDDLFNEVPVFQAVGPQGNRFPGLTGATTSAEHVADFRGPAGPGGGGGRYRLTYDWAVVAA
jgi:hypothetical protein